VPQYQKFAVYDDLIIDSDTCSIRQLTTYFKTIGKSCAEGAFYHTKHLAISSRYAITNSSGGIYVLKRIGEKFVDAGSMMADINIDSCFLIDMDSNRSTYLICNSSYIRIINMKNISKHKLLYPDLIIPNDLYDPKYKIIDKSMLYLYDYDTLIKIHTNPLRVVQIITSKSILPTRINLQKTEECFKVGNLAVPFVFVGDIRDIYESKEGVIIFTKHGLYKLDTKKLTIDKIRSYVYKREYSALGCYKNKFVVTTREDPLNHTLVINVYTCQP
jgi:hypothetical protein